MIKTHSIESRCDIEPENRLFAGMSVHFEPGQFKGWGREGVKMRVVSVSGDVWRQRPATATDTEKEQSVTMTAKTRVW